MTGFVVAAALLVLAALWFVLPPLLRRQHQHDDVEAALRLPVYRQQLAELVAERSAGSLSEQQYQEAKRELERRVLDEYQPQKVTQIQVVPARRSWLLPAIVGTLMIAVVIAMYAVLGAPALLTKPAPGDLRLDNITEQQFSVMAQRIAQHLKRNPNDLRGWAMLGRSYQMLGRLTDAAQAYGRAAIIAPDNAEVLAEYAGALALSKNNSFAGEPSQLLAQALKLNPDSPRALMLSGAAAFQRSDYQSAIGLWQQLQKVMPKDAEYAQQVADGIAQARAALGQAASAPAAAGAGVSGTVSLSAALQSKAAPSDTLFIFARAVDGPKMPLAVVRKTAKDLPLRFALDDTLAMSPATKLSAFSRVTVEARISKSGSATAQSGDLAGSSGVIEVGASGLDVVIDKVIE